MVNKEKRRRNRREQKLTITSKQQLKAERKLVEPGTVYRLSWLSIDFVVPALTYKLKLPTDLFHYIANRYCCFRNIGRQQNWQTSLNTIINLEPLLKSLCKRKWTMTIFKFFDGNTHFYRLSSLCLMKMISIDNDGSMCIVHSHVCIFYVKCIILRYCCCCCRCCYCSGLFRRIFGLFSTFLM